MMTTIVTLFISMLYNPIPETELTSYLDWQSECAKCEYYFCPQHGKPYIQWQIKEQFPHIMGAQNAE